MHLVITYDGAKNATISTNLKNSHRATTIAAERPNETLSIFFKHERFHLLIIHSDGITEPSKIQP
jgi:hypothetical protein